MKIEQLIVHHLRLDTPQDQAQALRAVEIAGERGGFPLLFQVGISMRNGKKLDERKDSLELIISPNWDRKKIPLVEELYEQGKKANLPEYWSIIKYQVFEPSFIYNLDILDITHEDFEYCAQLNFSEDSVWLGLLIFVKDELAEKILVKRKSDEKFPEKNEWDLNPKDSPETRSPLIFLNSAVGEYNMIKRIKAVEYVPRSSHETIPRYSLANLHQEFEKIDRYDSSKSCHRCGYHSYQTNVTQCKCKNVWYCDEICKKADVSHKRVC